MLSIFAVGALFVALGFLLRSVMSDSDEKRCVTLIDDLHARLGVQAEVIRGMEEVASRDHVVKTGLQQEAVDYAGKVVDMQNDVRDLTTLVKSLRHERNVWEAECRAWRASDEMRRDASKTITVTSTLDGKKVGPSLNRVRVQK